METLQGALTFAFVLISTILGIIIVIKYFTFRKRELLLVGITWILIVSPYWPDAINFILILVYGTLLDIKIYFFLANALIPIIHITWMIAFTDLLYKQKQKTILLIFTAEAILFEIFFIYFLIIDPSLIGTQIAPFYVEWTDFIVFYLLFSILIFLITGILFAQRSLKSDKKELRLKGKFLMIAFITFATGTFIDAIGSLTEITLVLARTFVISGAFMFYIGFTLPTFIKELFLKED
ncbi:MAG: hypothetical protein EU532_02080 [Promethearchaeota archaeon]|nr:MAG: hypothetical protein EU532_02080 [Candidatus Lokiarchaeota archaeon]